MVKQTIISFSILCLAAVAVNTWGEDSEPNEWVCADATYERLVWHEERAIEDRPSVAGTCQHEAAHHDEWDAPIAGRWSGYETEDGEYRCVFNAQGYVALDEGWTAPAWVNADSGIVFVLHENGHRQTTWKLFDASRSGFSVTFNADVSGCPFFPPAHR